jgi:cytochrome c-type biogenesis protein CcmH
VTSFWIAAAALAAAALGILIVPLWRDRRRRGQWSVSGVAAALLIAPVAVALYLHVTTWDAEEAEQASEGARLVAELAARMQQTPDDVEGWRLLGRSYMALGQYAQGRSAYREAWSRTPAPDNELKLAFAEALVLTDRSMLTGDAGRMIEEVLEQEPGNPKALWYGGLAAVEVGAQDAARERWTRLLELGPPEQLANVLRAQLAQMGAPSAAAAASGPTLRLRVRLGEGHSLAQLGPQTALFIFARDPAGGPPVAVIRQPASALPGEFTLSDASSMIPGRSLGNFEQLTIVARLSQSGQPTEQPGDLFAETLVQPVDGTVVDLVIDQVVQ